MVWNVSVLSKVTPKYLIRNSPKYLYKNLKTYNVISKNFFGNPKTESTLSLKDKKKNLSDRQKCVAIHVVVGRYYNRYLKYVYEYYAISKIACERLSSLQIVKNQFYNWKSTIFTSVGLFLYLLKNYE